jgi:hypothetical protein
MGLKFTMFINIRQKKEHKQILAPNLLYLLAKCSLKKPWRLV